MPPMNLTEGAIALLSSGDVQYTDIRRVVQVADIRLVNLQNNHERYRIFLSDGSYTQQGMLATQLNDLVRSGKLRKGSIVQLMQFVCNMIQNRMIIIVINLDVIVENCDLIGEPKQYPTKTVVHASSNAPPTYPKSLTNIHKNKMPLINLTEGVIAMLSNDRTQDTDIKLVLQVAHIRLVSTQNQNNNNERYQILISDGSYTQQGVLGSHRNDLVRSGKLQKGSIIQLTQLVRHWNQNRMRTMIITDLDVIVEKCDPIGQPKEYPIKTDDTSTPIRGFDY